MDEEEEVKEVPEKFTRLLWTMCFEAGVENFEWFQEIEIENCKQWRWRRRNDSECHECQKVQVRISWLPIPELSVNTIFRIGRCSVI